MIYLLGHTCKIKTVFTSEAQGKDIELYIPVPGKYWNIWFLISALCETEISAFLLSTPNGLGGNVLYDLCKVKSLLFQNYIIIHWKLLDQDCLMYCHSV